MEETGRDDVRVDSLGRPTEGKEKEPLPQVGTKFFIEGVLYKVIYVNEGKRRFSASPMT